MRLRTVILFLIILYSISLGNTIVFGEELKIGTSSEILTLNPIFAYRWEDRQLIDLIFEGLVHQEGNAIISDLARDTPESWHTSVRGNFIEIQVPLKQGISWHKCSVYNMDNTFDADDVVATFENLRMLKYPFKNKLRDISTISKSRHDDYMVMITYPLDRYKSTSLFNLDFKIIPSEVFPRGSELMTKHDKFGLEDSYTAGSGPYRATYISTECVNLKLTSHNLSGQNSFNEINSQRYSQQTVGIQNVESNELDLFFDYDAKHIGVVSGLNKSENFDMPSATLTALMFNHWAGHPKLDTLKDTKYFHRATVEKFSKLEVRKALAHAINVDTILYNVFYQDTERRISGPFAPGGGGIYSPKAPYYKYDPDYSKEIVAKLGLDTLDIALLCLQVEGLYIYHNVCENIQFDLKRVGIDVILKDITTNRLDSLIKRGEFDLVLFEWTGEYFPNLSMWDNPDQDGINNFWGYRRDNDPGFYETIKRATDPSNDQRIADYYFIHETLNSDYAGIWLWNRKIWIVKRKELVITSRDPFNFYRKMIYWYKSSN